MRGSCEGIVATQQFVILRECRVSSTPRPIDSITDVAGILGHPPQCAIAHKASDDVGAMGDSQQPVIDAARYQPRYPTGKPLLCPAGDDHT